MKIQFYTDVSGTLNELYKSDVVHHVGNLIDEKYLNADVPVDLKFVEGYLKPSWIEDLKVLPKEVKSSGTAINYSGIELDYNKNYKVVVNGANSRDIPLKLRFSSDALVVIGEPIGHEFTVKFGDFLLPVNIDNLKKNGIYTKEITSEE